jgi:hypothetical protein
VTETMFPSIDRAPYELPLSIERFERSLRTGHGRAWRHAAGFGVADRRDTVMKATLHDLSYDAQCEGERAPWLLAIIRAAGAWDAIVPDLIRLSLLPPEDDRGSAFWHDVQRCAVLKELALSGETGAKESLYGKFRKSVYAPDLLACEEILELDGADGLIHVCEEMGRWLLDDNDLHLDDDPLGHYDERHGDGSAIRILESVARASTDVARYLDHLSRSPGGSSGDGHLNLANVRLDPNARASRYADVDLRSGRDIVSMIGSPRQDPGVLPLVALWGHRAAESDLMPVVEALEAETDPSRIKTYLRVFSRRPMPRVADSVMNLCEHEDRDVRWAVHRTLGRVDDPRVREAALAGLRPDRMAEGSLLLFRSSYREGDHRAIENAMFLPDDPDELHTLQSDLVDVFEDRPVPEATRLLLFAYEHGPCGICRDQAVEVIESGDSVPPWLAEECRFDSMEPLRTRFGGASNAVS